MSKVLLLVARIVDESGVVLSDQLLQEKQIIIPENISELGMTQKEQLEYIGQAERILLQEQVSVVDCPYDKCPQCNSSIYHNGSGVSLFHGFYSEHKLRLKKWICSSTICDWSYNPSIKSYYGDNISPELKKSQAELGSTLTYRKGSACLKLLAGDQRKIHNHMRVKTAVDELGRDLERYLEKKESANHSSHALTSCGAEELIIATDGVHVHDADNKGHNYEAMVAKIYQPQDVIQKDKNHAVIVKKQCVGSAKKDKQKTMKARVLDAARRSGMTKETTVTGLADGAKNCWNIIESLKPYCAMLICILDWFHIGKYFTNVANQLPKKERRLLDIAKQALWQGHFDACLYWLEFVKHRISNTKQLDKLQALIDYLINNKGYIVNYDHCKRNNLPYSSSIAESTVEHYASSRLMKSQKMQWTRDGAHHILQIRGAIISNVWDQFCRDVLRINRHKNCA